MKRFSTLLIISAFYVNAALPTYAQNGNAVGQERSQVRAAHVEASIAVDGRLDEVAWQQAAPVSDFRQFEPDEGDPATQRTEVRVLYGADNLYVGAMLYDDDPARIEQALTQRDDYNRADWFLVSIDAYLDRRTAYVFGISAAGVQYDAVQTGGGGGPGGPGDDSWDAIWYSDVRMTSDGWVVEMRIPYSMLRFSEAAAQTWGIQFRRRIPRLGEVAEWPLVPRTERSNLVARFEQLTGIEGIAPRRNVQLRPYTVARLQTQEDPNAPGELARDAAISAGGDLKVGLGSNMTLDATIKPDFGQVESDPAVLNLSAFEQDLDERRPFFVEGAQIYEFRIGPGDALYSRRIGADAPILGAAKLSGRSAGGLSYGTLLATTGHDFTPNQHYGVMRMSQQVGAYSSAGGVLTAFDGPVFGTDRRRRSVVGGTDWDLRFSGNQYGLEGFALFSHRSVSEAQSSASTGLAAQLQGVKRQGAWQGHLILDIFGDTFNPNDVGRLDRVNTVTIFPQIERELNGARPFGPFQRGSVGATVRQHFSYREGYNLGQDIELEAEGMLRSFQEIRLDVNVGNPFGGYDLYETRGLGPWTQPTNIELRGSFRTDERRRWQVEPQVNLAFDENGGREYEVGTEANWNVGSRLDFSAEVEGEWERGTIAWTSNETFMRTEEGWRIGQAAAAPGALGPGDFVAFDDQGELEEALVGVESHSVDRYYVPVFGARDTRALDFTLRGTITFVTNLSLEVYSQLFAARGRYDDFQVLQSPGDLAPLASFPKRDEFAFSSLQSNMVLRWQYRPGSTLYVVWSHGRRANDELNPLAPWGTSPYNQSLNEQVGDGFSAFPDNTFSIKLTYTFLP